MHNNVKFEFHIFLNSDEQLRKHISLQRKQPTMTSRIHGFSVTCFRSELVRIILENMDP